MEVIYLFYHNPILWTYSLKFDADISQYWRVSADTRYHYWSNTGIAGFFVLKMTIDVDSKHFQIPSHLL